MAAKILKVKLWDDDEGGKWKKNVQEIDGEVLCGRTHIVYRFHQGGDLILTSCRSIPIHSVRNDKEGQQTRFPQICSSSKSQGAI